MPAENPAFNFMYFIEYTKPDGAIWYYVGNDSPFRGGVYVILSHKKDDARLFDTHYKALTTRWQLFDKNDDIQIIEINF